MVPPTENYILESLKDASEPTTQSQDSSLRLTVDSLQGRLLSHA